MSTGLLSCTQAAECVAACARALAARPPVSETVSLAAASGRVLAAPLLADRDQPPFPRSTRDGYASRAADLNTHTALSIAGSTRAGSPPPQALPRQTAWQIMTGAALPPGANAVAMVEHVERTGDFVRLLPPRTLAPGDNFVATGAEARSGDELLPAGTRLHPAQIALAATCGHAALNVYRRPRVAILTTGDELVPVDAAPGPGQIRNSNAPMLAALVSAAGAEAIVLPPAADSADALDAALATADAADLLLISGGVSAGTHDLVEPALERRGARFHFTGVRIQPGKPLVFGELRRRADGSQDDAPGRLQFFFGLPGNPISSAATFALFAAPLLATLSGEVTPAPPFAAAVLAEPICVAPGLTRFLPARSDFAPPGTGLPSVAPVPWHGSGDLAAFARANCFLVVPEDTPALETGALVRILPI